ncbi:hypothetical protein, partial [Nonomuraea sp. NPDC050691]|uniref:hypothetical protein n=1 Tax=Nonomuraea sp. NPDC050691 TaxID=3155661 RepID=UPI0033CC74AB
ELIMTDIGLAGMRNTPAYVLGDTPLAIAGHLRPARAVRPASPIAGDEAEQHLAWKAGRGRGPAPVTAALWGVGPDRPRVRHLLITAKNVFGRSQR